MLSTNGDTFLGGEDFDLRLIEFLAEEFKKESGIDLHNDPLALQRLKEGGRESQDRALQRQQTEVNLPYITADATGPKHLVVKLTAPSSSRWWKIWSSAPSSRSRWP